MKYELEKLDRTCIACPSQWEGRTVDDRAVYIRYRGGNLDLWISEPGAEDISFQPEELVFNWDEGPAFDGSLTYDQLVQIVYDNLPEDVVIIWPPDHKVHDEESVESIAKALTGALEVLTKLAESGKLQIISSEEEARMRSEKTGEIVMASDDKFVNEDMKVQGITTATSHDVLKTVKKKSEKG